jgi:PAS domain S-box-containing protein
VPHDARDILHAADSPVHQLALLIDSVDDYAIFLLDREGHVLTWNPGAQRSKGYDAIEVIGEHVSIFYTPEDRESGRADAALAAAERDGRFRDEGWRVRKDGARFWASVLVTAVRDDHGNLLGFGKVTRDLTELRIAQQELELFAGSAAHDLQEPLRTISGFSELLARRHGAALPPDGQEFLGHIAAAAARMQRLIADLLAYARTAPGEVKSLPVPLAGCVSVMLEAVQGALSDRGLDVGVDVPGDAVVLADAPGVELLLQNLVSNAIKFADPERPAVAVAARREGGEWVVTVTDNGPGVAADQRERIFEPFTQLRRGDFGGTGLGLSIARRIAERHRGRIGVEAAPSGTGCVFWFALPAAE